MRAVGVDADAGVVGVIVDVAAQVVAAIDDEHLAAGVGLYKIDPRWHPTLLRLKPFLVAIVVGYAAGVFSLSRAYMQQTYMTLGLAEAYLCLALPSPPDWFRTNGRMWGRLFAMGIVGLVGLKLLTQLLLTLG